MSSRSVIVGECVTLCGSLQDRQESRSGGSRIELDIVCAVSGVLAKLYQAAVGDVFFVDHGMIVDQAQVCGSYTDHSSTSSDT